MFRTRSADPGPFRLNGLSPPSGLVDHQLPGPAGAKTAAGLRTSSAG